MTQACNWGDPISYRANAAIAKITDIDIRNAFVLAVSIGQRFCLELFVYLVTLKKNSFGK